MSIRKDFEKAFNAQVKEAVPMDRMIAEAAALWAAKWMAEMCDDELKYKSCTCGQKIRQLAKELES